MKNSSEGITLVTCAIIEKNGRVLCAQRGEQMNLPFKWEFPGGKVEDGESLENCLAREILEELGLEIAILERLPSSRHGCFPHGVIELIPFLCRLAGGGLLIKEHKQVRWLAPEELKALDWAEADIPIVHHYVASKNG